MLRKIVYLSLVGLVLFSTTNAWSRPPKKAIVDQPWEAKADKNNDGVVGKKESKRWKKSHSGPVDTPRENKIDANDDGVIQQVELQHKP